MKGDTPLPARRLAEADTEEEVRELVAGWLQMRAHDYDDHALGAFDWGQQVGDRERGTFDRSERTDALRNAQGHVIAADTLHALAEQVEQD